VPFMGSSGDVSTHLDDTVATTSPTGTITPTWLPDFAVACIGGVGATTAISGGWTKSTNASGGGGGLQQGVAWQDSPPLSALTVTWTQPSQVDSHCMAAVRMQPVSRFPVMSTQRPWPVNRASRY